MDKEFLEQVSVLAEDDCLISNKKLAEEIIKIHNPDCDVVLASVFASHCDDEEEISSVNDVSFIWYDRNAGEYGVKFLPVFWGDPGDIPSISDVFEVEEGDVFCYEGMVYYADFSDDNVVIRRLNMLFSQEIVEKIYADTEPDVVIEDIFLVDVKDVTRTGLKRLMTCWYVVREDGYIDYMPVFLDDVFLLDEYNLSSLISDEIKHKQRFLSHERNFSLQKDVQGKLFIRSEVNFTVKINNEYSEQDSKYAPKMVPLKRKDDD